MSTKLAILGAGGKMGLRITDQIVDDPNYALRCVEPDPERRAALTEREIQAMPLDSALEDADGVILAIPDPLIGDVTADIVPRLAADTLVIMLDPAAAYADVLAPAEDVAYFVTHPCHPPLYDGERPPAFADDLFGGTGRARQDIVCALHSGTDTDFDRGVTIARDIFAPVRRTHRLTIEQMALLEPALVESLQSALLDVIHDGMERVIAQGVDQQAAYDFVMGHLRIQIAVIFGLTEFPFSEGAQRKLREGRHELIREDWEEILTPERTKESVRDIVDPS